jgi:hypothetical protein
MRPWSDLSRIAPCSALSRESPLKLLDGSDTDAVKLRELDDANAGLEIGDDGRGLVGWNGRAAEPHAAGARKPGRSTSDNRGLARSVPALTFAL